MASVTVDPALPLEVLVDFQSRHRAAFRLFRRRPGAPEEFLKEGFSDTSTFIAAVAPGDVIVHEFIFFAEPFDFRAVLVFRQDGRLCDGGVVPVDEQGDVLFAGGEVALR
jgi:hypothetical protein